MDPVGTFGLIFEMAFFWERQAPMGPILSSIVTTNSVAANILPPQISKIP